MKTQSDNINKVGNALEACLGRVPFVQLRDMDFEPSGYGARPDVLARISVPDGEISLLIAYKDSGQPRIAREAVHQIEWMVRAFPRAYGVFAAPYISPESARICRESQIGYLDLAGNCRLSAWPFHIEREGRPNPATEKRDLRSLYSPKAARVVRVLLASPNRSWKTEEMASEAGVSVGQVANVKKLLGDREWIARDTRGIRLQEPRALLEEWAAAYNRNSNTTHEYYSLKTPSDIENDIAEVCNRRNIRYGLTALSGGARYAPVVRYQRVTAYVDEASRPEVASELGLKQVSSGANVALVAPYDESVFYGSVEIDGCRVCSPVQVYLDLAGLRGRGEEAADALLKGAIEPRWE